MPCFDRATCDPACRPTGKAVWRLTAIALVLLLPRTTLRAEQPAPIVGQADALDPDHAAKMSQGLDLFKQSVRTTLLSSCLKCHGGESTESQLSVVDRESLLRGGENGPAIVLGKSGESLLYKLIAHEEEPHMPFEEAKLSAAAIEAIGKWIDLGAPYDGSLLASAEQQQSWTERKVPPEAKEHWAFQPLSSPQPPAVSDSAWCRTPIDPFILAKLDASGLKPNPPSDRRRLIRRVYFDVIGLPPPPEEVEAFVKDPDPAAFEHVVDRLLASPHYGERWASYWLDIARFAESHGFEHDYDRPTAYHYRDFVIKALNSDLPYDTFVRWQLAGDELAPDNYLAMMATGFLAAGVHSTQITKNEVEKHRYDEMDDMLSTIGTSMLALTIGCARCHDHKFDPIPQADYYRLLATFTTTIRSETDVDLDPTAYRQAKAAFDEAHQPYEEAIAQYEREKLPAAFVEWETSWRTGSERLDWVILEPASSKSQGGAGFKPQDDSSLLATGANAASDEYEFEVRTDLAGITAIRVEALADPSLVAGGPGRATNGNFALSDMKVTVAAASGEGEPQTVTLVHPRATFEQKGLPIAAAIDGDEKSGWAVDPEFGKDHAAVFETSEPIGQPGGSILRVTLSFKTNDQHAIGRVRLSASMLPAEAIPALNGMGIMQSLYATLQKHRGMRDAEESLALLKWFRTMDPAWRDLRRAADEHLKTAPKPNTVVALVSSEGLAPIRLHTQGEDFFPETYFLRRGDTGQKETVAPPGFLQVLVRTDEADRWREAPPEGWRTSYRRRSLANWLTDVDHGAGGLLARVIVNRVWQHHMGQGLVLTPSDFGNRSEPPSHPELLDWLARDLIRNEWQLKSLHKLILTSAVYQQSSDVTEASFAQDPANRLFWRRPRMRLEAEAIRDAVLAVSGMLDPTMFGPGTLEESSRRRSIYFTVKRSKLMPMMQVFDAPDTLQSVGQRVPTVIAPQALLLMNGPAVRDDARHFAERVAADATVNWNDADWNDAVQRGYLIALGRPPVADELSDGVAFLEEQYERIRNTESKDMNDDAARRAALVNFCQVLLCLNEFIYVD